MSEDDPDRQLVRALILVPTKELSEQVSKHLRQLLVYCEKIVSVANLVSGAPAHLQRYVFNSTFYRLPFLTSHRVLMSDEPDITIATPTRALSFLQAKVGLFPLCFLLIVVLISL